MPLPTLTPAQRAAALEKAAQARTAARRPAPSSAPANSAPSRCCAPRMTPPPVTCASSSSSSRYPGIGKPGRTHCWLPPASRPPGGEDVPITVEFRGDLHC